MTETAKERIYRKAFEEIKRVCDTQDHVDNHLLRFFITKKMMEIEKLPVTTDKLLVEKLQEQLNTAKKALTEISELSDPLDNDTLMSVVANVAFEALAAIGEDLVKVVEG
ncbi:hypothetical protein [Lactococcus lactis]|uniref:hypothetical protein n=1 Tax=Lactococcus lactis TaxID=1358 RepID=UPI0018986E6C|nr:hypothetical protein [Lactococcus lactis]